LLGRLERHEESATKEPSGIGGRRRTRPCSDTTVTVGGALDHVAHAGDAFHPGLERDGRRQQCADPQVALFELRQALAAEPRAENDAHDQECQRDRGRACSGGPPSGSTTE